MVKTQEEQESTEQVLETGEEDSKHALSWKLKKKGCLKKKKVVKHTKCCPEVEIKKLSKIRIELSLRKAAEVYCIDTVFEEKEGIQLTGWDAYLIPQIAKNYNKKKERERFKKNLQQ